jgi:hypothetical protein
VELGSGLGLSTTNVRCMRSSRYERRLRSAPSWAVRPPLALALALLLGGCGSSYTKADFVGRADGICLGAVRDLRTLGADAPASGDGQALAEYLARALPVVRKEAMQLRKLPRPPLGKKGREALDSYLAALSQSVLGYTAAEQAARSGNQTGLASDLETLRANPVDRLAGQIGLRYCGTPEATTR